jgi:FixJ family two-component response regulator
MTLAERAKLATAVRSRASQERADRVLALLARGECLKRAAHATGVSCRSARRYRAKARAAA